MFHFNDMGQGKMSESVERVILLDANNLPIGCLDKSEVHNQNTPLHLGFSCYVLNAQGQLLITRRALCKVAWPGVWTNSVCGHPAPGEPIEEAVRRRSRYELGLDVDKLELMLAWFKYRVTDASGVVENEFCPVFMARTVYEPQLLASEVMDCQWVSVDDAYSAVRVAPWAFSPWMVLQLTRLLRSSFPQ